MTVQEPGQTVVRYDELRAVVVLVLVLFLGSVVWPKVLLKEDLLLSLSEATEDGLKDLDVELR